MLGLKALDIYENTLKAIHKNFDWLYNTITPDDKKTFKMVCAGKTDGMFQIESDMMKGLISDIQPTTINDLSALIAIGRPGPLSYGTDKMFAEQKRDPTKRKKILPNVDDIVARSYGCIIYQEDIMMISKRIAGFDDGQSDSLTRKTLAKKKASMLPILRRCLIYGKKNYIGPKGWEEDNNAPWYDPKGKYGGEIPGAVSNGYDAKEVDDFFHDIQGFASYCFNLGHSLAYSFLVLISAYLKAHYPVPYMASVLSMQTDDKKKEKYMKVCEDMGIKITTPDINKSKETFTAIDDHTIAYGLSSIKGVNNVTAIIENAPYKNLRDAMERIPSKAFNKRVAEALIESGAFDFENPNRKELLNEYISIRNESRTKSQKEPLLENTTYDKVDCMEMEAKTLGRAITYDPAWKGALPGEPLSGNCTFKDIKHHITKSSHKKMAMLTVINETYAVPALLFPKEYPKYMSILKNYQGEKKDHPAEVFFVRGIMNKEGDKLIINKIEPMKIAGEEPDHAPSFVFDPMTFGI